MAGLLASDKAEAFAEVVLRKAMDETGAPLFDRGDAVTLKQCVPAHIVKQAGMAIVGGATVADAAGNSNGTRASRGDSESPTRLVGRLAS